MSIETNMYIGIYIKVPNSMVDFDKTVYRDPETGEPRKTKFNPETGEPNIEIVTKQTRRVHPWPDIDDLLLDGEEFSGDSDEFWCPQYGPWGDKFSLFMPNRLGTKYKERMDRDDYGCIDLLTLDINYKSLIEEFREEYKPWLDIYKREYGEIYIGYGVITYSN